jgi:hypothetical protein
LIGDGHAGVDLHAGHVFQCRLVLVWMPAEHNEQVPASINASYLLAYAAAEVRAKAEEASSELLG